MRGRIEFKQGDVVVLDNLSSHQGADAAALVEACGVTLLLLPPYGKLKHLLGKAGERSRESPWNRIDSLLDDFPPHQ